MNKNIKNIITFTTLLVGTSLMSTAENANADAFELDFKTVTR
ncbi:MAG: hypothetical protein ACI965_000772 [Paraglaciecola sp.]|jgi:hypothetical protein